MTDHAGGTPPVTDAPYREPSSWRAHVRLVSILLALNVGFRFAFARSFPQSPYALIPNPNIMATMDRVLWLTPLSLLLPMEYEPQRFYWPPTLIVPMYVLHKVFSPFVVSVLTSSLLLVTGYVVSWRLFGSGVASFTFSWLWIFGTQLTYSYTLGNLLALNLILAYFLVNLLVAHGLMLGGAGCRRGGSIFVVTLVVAALSSELWLNYGIFLLVASAFLFCWGRHHARKPTVRGSRLVFASTMVVMVAYVVVRTRVAYQYMAPGAEEELILAYSRPVLMIEDFVGNYFTFLYTALTNFLPSIFVGSNAIVWYGPEQIIREQHGYHEPFSYLVPVNYLFFWRYYAGIAAAGFAYLAGRSVRRSWRECSVTSANVVVLVIMIAVGFSTHLMIKFRPYNSVPALPYKAIVSVLGTALLISYLVALGRRHLGTFRSRALTASVLLVVLVGGFTRPRMLSSLLAQVGLQGFSDPLGDTFRFARRVGMALKELF
jgi:hypothetical protein